MDNKKQIQALLEGVVISKFITFGPKIWFSKELDTLMVDIQIPHEAKVYLEEFFDLEVKKQLGTEGINQGKFESNIFTHLVRFGLMYHLQLSKELFENLTNRNDNYLKKMKELLKDAITKKL